MNILINIGCVAGFYLILFFIVRSKRNKDKQKKYKANITETSQKSKMYNQDREIIKSNFVSDGYKYVLDFANEKYNQDNEPVKRGDPLTFTSYTPAPLSKEQEKGSLLVTLLFLDSPLMWALFPSVRRSIRDYINRD
jgi:hypothetical protein